MLLVTMNKYKRVYSIIVMFAFPFLEASARSIATLKVHTDFPFLSENKLTQDLFYSADSAFGGVLQIYCYKFKSEDDSVLICAKRNVHLKFKSGINSVKILYITSDTDVFCLRSFYDVLVKTDAMPPGNYKTYINIKSDDSQFSKIFLQTIDSNLSPNSPVRREINSVLLPKQKKILGIDIGNKLKSSIPASKTLDLAAAKMSRSLAAKGYITEHLKINGKDYVDVYYKDWFIGRYEAPVNESVSSQMQKQQNALMNNTPSLTNTSLENHPSLFSQFRTLKKEKEKENNIEGEISLSRNFSNGQEQYSDQDNNFYELRGRIEFPVSGMPVEVEGLYTTQDANRQVKASYIHVHYDVDKAKTELAQLTNSYNTIYSQTLSTSKGTAQVFQTYINKLERQQDKLQQELKNEVGADTKSGGKVDFDALKQNSIQSAEKQRSNTASADSAGSINKSAADEQKIKDSVNQKYKIAEEKYKRLLAIEKQINKYKTLLAQDKNTNYFDSAIVYSKMKGIQDPQQMSYKQLAKKADNLLPDGQIKKITTGITNFDAGMFPKYESQFTMSGQTLKGISTGYDFGICQAGLTIGNTEYIGRDGSVDKYFSYAAKISSKTYEGQKIGLVYYTYLPSHQMLSDQFFKNMDIAAPGFRSPVHIVSAIYDGTISKYVIIKGELASSMNQTDSAISNHLSSGDKTAYAINVAGNIPNTYVTVEGNYSKAGTGFQNNTLPISPAGTEQYKITVTNEFFRSFLTAGIDYNYMRQNNFASTGGNRQWGFNVQTHTRRYPSLGISYKPFSTFRSYTDTLSIPQHPLIGSIWTGKATYQLKRAGGKSFRFMFLYSKNTSSMDTVSYGSTLLQLTCMYTIKQLMLSVTGGQMKLSGTNTDSLATMPNNTKFMSLTGSYSLSKQFNISGGQDFGFADFGFCRYALNGGIVYRFMKIPVITRINLRYNTYELDHTQPWKNLYSGNIDLTWQFKSKMQTKQH